MARGTQLKAEAVVTLNGTQAEAVLDTLKAKAKELRQAIIDATKNGIDPTQIQQMNKELNALNSSIAGVKKQTADYSAILKNINGSTISDLEKTYRSLNAEIKKTIPGSQQYETIQGQMHKVKGRIDELTTGIREHQTVWKDLANGFNKYAPVFFMVAGSLTGVGMAIKSVSEEAAHLDDVYSNVMRTTGLTKTQVNQLNDEFKKMGTRTTREELNKLAVEAGKLGIEGTKNILDFVDAGNQIKTTLGQELGDDAILQVGKMVQVYKNSTKQLQGVGLKEQMLSVGSAITSIGMNSSAAEPYLVDFAGRLGGISAQAHIAMGDILGYASALDQSMQKQEMSATAFQNFVTKIFTDPRKFAKMAGENAQTFWNNLSQDANGTILNLLQKLNEKGGLQQLAPMFQEMGLDGARAVGVLSSMAANIDKIKEAQKLANSEMAKGTSATNQYNLINNNLQANLEKAKNELVNVREEIGKRLQGVLLTGINSFTGFLKLFIELPKWISENRGLLITLTTAWTAYILVLNKSTIAKWLDIAATQAGIIAVKAEVAITYALAAAKALLTGNVTRARAAMELLGKTLGTNPYTILAIAITAVGIALYKLATAQTAVQKAFSEANAELETEKTKANELFGALQKAGQGTRERADLIQVINDKYKDYLPYLLTEKSSYDQIQTALSQVNRQLEQQILLKYKNQTADYLAKEAGDKMGPALMNIRKTLSGSIKEDFLKDQAMKDITSILNSMDGDVVQKAVDYASKYIKNGNLLFGANPLAKIDSYIKEYRRAFLDWKNQMNDLDNTFKVQNPLTIYKPTEGGITTTTTSKVPDDQDAGKKYQKWFEQVKRAREAFDQDMQNQEHERYLNGEINEMEYHRRLSEIEENSSDFYADIAQKKNTRVISYYKDFWAKYNSMSQLGAKESADAYAKTLTNEEKAQKDIIDTLKTNREKAIADFSKGKPDYLGNESEDNSNKEYLLNAIDFADKRVKIEEDALTAIKEATITIGNEKVKLISDQEDNITAAKIKAADARINLIKSEYVKLQNEEDQLNLKKDWGSISMGKAADQQYEIIKKRIELAQKEATVKGASTVKIQAALKKQAAAETDLTKLYVDEYKRRTGIAAQFGEASGNILGNLIINNNDALRSSLITLVDMGLDYLKATIEMAIAGATARELSSKPFPAGLTTAAIEVGLIEAAFAVAKTAIGGIFGSKTSSSGSSLSSSSSSSSGERIVNNYADGKYDVIGASDGKSYSGVPYIGGGVTGIVSRPALISESGSELIISSPDLSRLQRHINYPIIVSAINDARAGIIRQYADGNYSSMSSQQATQVIYQNDPEMKLLLAQNSALLQHLKDNGIMAGMYFSEYDKKRAILDASRNRGTLGKSK